MAITYAIERSLDGIDFTEIATTEDVLTFVNSGLDDNFLPLGFVAECTGDNIFILKNKKLFTPTQAMGSLRGITRDAVIEIAKKFRIPTDECILTRHEIFNAEECFLTGTAAEIIPVVSVDGRKIGNGKPGKITFMLMQGFKKVTGRDGVKYKV